MGRTVLHGIDQSGLSTKRPGETVTPIAPKGNDGSTFYETDTLNKRVFDEGQEEWLPDGWLAAEIDITGGDSGAIGIHDIPGARLPAGTIIWDSCIDVLETFTSAGDTAQMAISAQADNDIVSAVAINNGTPWDAGLRAGIPLGAIASAVKIVRDANLRYSISVQAITAGKLRILLHCIRSTQVVTEEESSSSSSSSSSPSSSSSSSSSNSSSVSSSSSSSSSSSQS